MGVSRPRVCLGAVALAATLAGVSTTPAAAATIGAGAGVAEINVVFSQPIMAEPNECFATAFSLNGGTQNLGLAASTDVPLLNGTTEYVGPAGISGSGGSTPGICAAQYFETGALSLSISGSSSVSGTVSCSLAGNYIRVAAHVHAQLSGTCTLNGITLPGINFLAEGDFVPTQGNGVTSNITAGLFAGPYAMFQQ